MATTTIATTTLTEAEEERIEAARLKKEAEEKAEKERIDAFNKRMEELVPKHMAEIKKLEDELKEQGVNFKKTEKLDNLRKATMGTEEEMLELIKLLS